VSKKDITRGDVGNLDTGCPLSFWQSRFDVSPYAVRVCVKIRPVFFSKPLCSIDLWLRTFRAKLFGIIWNNYENLSGFLIALSRNGRYNIRMNTATHQSRTENINIRVYLRNDSFVWFSVLNTKNHVITNGYLPVAQFPKQYAEIVRV